MSSSTFTVRKWVKPEDLNQHGALFGGKLLQWIDEEAAIIALMQLGSLNIVTRHISEIDFLASAYRGDYLELIFSLKKFGRTSLSLKCTVINSVTGKEILTIDDIVFVTIDDEGKPHPHGQTESVETTKRLRK